MTVKMKGLLKGLRYISQIFEADNGSSDEEEGEMQIGLPTDVKHVAHIGWDGPSVSSPSWMQKNEEEKSTPPPHASAPLNINKGEDHQDAKSATKSISEELNRAQRGDLPEVPKPARRRQSKSSTLDSSTENNELSSDVAPKRSSRSHSTDLSESMNKQSDAAPKRSSRSHSTDLSEAMNKQSDAAPKKSSRRHSTDLSEATTKPSRRCQNLSSSNNSSGVVSDSPSVPKSSRKKKLKETSSSVGVGSTRGRRRKDSIDGISATCNVPVTDQGSEPETEHNKKNNTHELCEQSSALNDLSLEERVFDGLS